MTCKKNSIKISVLVLAAFQCPPKASAQCELAKYIASDAQAADQFGTAVAIDNDLAVVGAFRVGTLSHGAAYIFRTNGNTWSEEQKLLASDLSAFDEFGCSVGISGDLALIGASFANDEWDCETGAAYVFRYNGNTWVEEKKLTALDAEEGMSFGRNVAIGGNVALIGANGLSNAGIDAGSAYVFRHNGLTWVEEQKLTPSDGQVQDQFGAAVAISGAVAIIGAFGADGAGNLSGAAYVFRHNGATWIEEQKLGATDAAAEDRFGVSVAVHNDTALVGAYTDDDLGSNAGAAYIFRHVGSSWVEKEKLTASDGATGDWFGYTVTLSEDKAVCSAPYHSDDVFASGAAYVFRLDGDMWYEQGKLTDSDPKEADLFGISVSVSGDHVLVGASADDDLCPSDPYCNSGAAYLFAISPDCNENQNADLCDVRDGWSFDVNGNSLPDDCEFPYGDVDRTTVVDVGDVLCCLDGFADAALCPNADLIPCNGDGNIDVGDILAVLDAFAGIYACVWNNGVWVSN